MNDKSICSYFPALAVKCCLWFAFSIESDYICRYKGKNMERTEDFAQVIRLHRRVAKLSRIQLAELAGVGKTVIYDIEKGKESIQFDTLRKIFKALNIRIVLKSPLMDNIQNSENEKS